MQYENKIISVKGKKFGVTNNLNICVPIVSQTYDELVVEIESIKSNPPDVIEWRVDQFVKNDNLEEIVKALKHINSEMADIPLIFTLIYNPIKNDEEKNVKLDIYRNVAKYKCIDLFNINPNGFEDEVESIIKEFNNEDIFVILTERNYYETPLKDEMLARLKKLEYLGANMCQLVVTPKNDLDVLTLLETVHDFHHRFGNIPCIGISSTNKGFISRVMGYKYGSAMTYGYSKKPSFAGQIRVDDMRTIYEIMDNYKE